MHLSISHWAIINNHSVVRDGNTILSSESKLGAGDIYRHISCSYPKFFKMDNLCKMALLNAESLLVLDNALLYSELDRSRVAVVISTAHGCLEVDKKYNETLKQIPSPALFVYTLPNIMLGEVAIRHGFKGEQVCNVSASFNPDETYFWVSDLMNKRGMDACLCGWADVTSDKQESVLFWVVKGNGTTGFTPAAMNEIYNRYKN